MAGPLSLLRVWKCYTEHPRRKFSLKVGTIFEDSPIGLDKWFCAMWLIANCKNGVSSYEIARDIHVTQKTAWFGSSHPARHECWQLRQDDWRG
jgi:hypothetical protein